MSDKLRVGLVGVGNISGAHMPAWLAMEDIEVVALCDIRPEQMEKYPDIPHFDKSTDMLEQVEMDILDICLPTPYHVDYACMAMEKGINVITEKPISLKKEDVARAFDTAKKNNVNFMVAQCLRWWPEYEMVRRYYESGEYGKLLSAHMWRLGNIPKWSWDNWMQDEKRSGFIPYDLHIHDLDFMVYAFGAPVDYQLRRARRPGQDYLTADYDFGDFFISCESAWYKGGYPFQSGFRFQFENALVTNEKGEGFKVYLGDGTVIKPLDNTAGIVDAVGVPSSNAYANEIRYFADCVKAGVMQDKVKPEQLETVIDILNRF